MTAKPIGEVRTIVADDILRSKGDSMAAVTGSRAPAFGNTLLKAAIRAAWYSPDESKEEKDRKVSAVMAAVAAFKPKNEVEGMIAAQAVALHLAAMECARRAMLPDQPGEAAARLRRDAANLSRAMVDMAEAIEHRRGKRPQIVRVERVVVEGGGQAIVGTVATRSGTPIRGEERDG